MQNVIVLNAFLKNEIFANIADDIWVKQFVKAWSKYHFFISCTFCGLKREAWDLTELNHPL